MNGEVSPRRRREVIAALRRGSVPSHGLDLLAVGLERFIPALDGDLDTAGRRRRGVQGGARGVRRGQDVPDPVPGRAGAAARVRRRRGADLRDPDAAAQAGDRLPAGGRGAADGVVPAQRAAPGAGLLAVHPGDRRHRRRPRAGRKGAGDPERSRRHAAGTAARRGFGAHSRVRAGAAGLPGGGGGRRRRRGRRARGLAGRPAARRGRGQAQRRDPGRARPLRRDGVPAGAARGAPRRGPPRAAARAG